jgi:hypothetical protein
MVIASDLGCNEWQWCIETGHYFDMGTDTGKSKHSAEVPEGGICGCVVKLRYH